jgi:hypothetical protein
MRTLQSMAMAMKSRVTGFRRGYLSAFLMSLIAGNAFGALPFITEDADPMGKGTSQVELWYARSTDKESVDGSVVKTDRNLPGATFGYGVADPLDLTLGFARRWGKVTVDGASSNDNGSAILTFSAKWRIHEISGYRFAVKPVVGYSYLVGGTGDDHTIIFGGWFIATKETESLAVSLNVGYLRSDFGSAADRHASRSGVWIVSALATYEVLKGLKLGCDVGASTNEDRADSTIPAYALAGATYTLKENVDIGLGLKFGITKPEPDLSGIAGVTIKF